MEMELRLSIEKELIEQAEAHAERRGVSVSELVAQYFSVLGELAPPEEEPSDSAPSEGKKHSAFTESLTGVSSKDEPEKGGSFEENSAFTRSLRGVMAGSDVTVEDYYRYLEKKYK